MTERAIMLSKGNELHIGDFRVNFHKPEKIIPSKEYVNLRINEIKLIKKALKVFDYNKQAASDALGIHRDALSRKMKKYNINIDRTEA
jgi:DNA-binding NtrC family response regulator